MKQVVLTCLAMLLLSLAGCTRQAEVPPPPAKPAPAFDTIRLERTACYGECPVYEIVLGRDGKGSFTGREHVKAKGAHEIHLGQDDVALLSAVLNRSGISSLKTSYQSEADGCTTVFTDQPSLSISVASGGKTRTVTLYHGCRGPAIPTEPLNWLADTIDFVANSRPLINGPQQ
jgi:hypothetical protein